jgi:hypothetical protein
VNGKTNNIPPNGSIRINDVFTSFDVVRIQSGSHSFEINSFKLKNDVRDVEGFAEQLKQTNLTPVLTRDLTLNDRSNVNQTGTTRIRVYSQFQSQDLRIMYSNYYNGNVSKFTPNTNNISVKAAIEINGVVIPMYFNGKRTVVIEGGANVLSDPIGCIINPGDAVYIRTFFDAGVGGYVPKSAQQFGITLGNNDGVTYGSDLVDSGTITNTNYDYAYIPTAIFGTAEVAESFLLVGDSIMQGIDDKPMQSIGFAARALYNKKIPYTKIAMSGESTGGFLDSLYLRSIFTNNHKSVLINYGRNDVNGNVPIATIKANLIKIWTYYKKKGLKVFQCTTLPRTSSTDFWITLENQTVHANDTIKVALNQWLLDTTSNGAKAQSNGVLDGVYDIAKVVEVNGKWKAATKIYSGTIQSATTNTLTDSAIPFPQQDLDKDAVVVITGGKGVGQTAQVSSNWPATQITVKTNWATIPDNTSTYDLYRVATNDGIHPSPSQHAVISTVI